METIAHRGCPFDAPENSMAAFAAAIEQGADRIEFDLQFTRDQHLVVSHDATTERLGDRRVDIEFATLAEVSAVRLADGSSVPTLRDVLALAQGRCRLDVELKSTSHAAAEQLVRELRGWAGDPMETIVTSFDGPVLRSLRGAGWEGRVGLLIGSRSLNLRQRAYEAWPMSALEFCRATDLVIHHQLVHRPLRQALQRRNLGLLLWTAVEDEQKPAAQRAALYDRLMGSGADGVIVGRVAEYRRHVASRVNSGRGGG